MIIYFLYTKYDKFSLVLIINIEIFWDIHIVVNNLNVQINYLLVFYYYILYF